MTQAELFLNHWDGTRETEKQILHFDKWERNHKFNHDSRLDKRNTKKKIRYKDRLKISAKELAAIGGTVELDKKEVLEKLKSWGIKIHPNTLLNYEKEGLIPPATFRNSRRTEHPEETPAQAYAAVQLKNGYIRLTYDDIRKARQTAIQAMDFKREKPDIEIERLIENIIINNLRKEKNIKDLTPYQWLISRMVESAVFWAWMAKDPESFSQILK